MVRIIVKRYCLPGREEELQELLALLRSKAAPQPGYISGETLKSREDPGLFVVVSTWSNVEQWRLWEGSRERRQASSLIAPLLRMPEETSVFDLVWGPDWSPAGADQGHVVDLGLAE